MKLISWRTPFSLASLALSMLSLAGCPGRITDPTPFIGGGGDGSMVTCSIPATQIEAQLIQPRCATSGCHDRASRQGSLDLQSADIAARLVGQPSTCMGRPLVDPSNRANSYFIAKLGEAPTCGARMPLGAPAFSASEIACVRTWVESLGGTPMTDAGMDAMSQPDAAMDVANPDTGVNDSGPDAPMDSGTTMPDSSPDSAPTDTGVPPVDTGVPPTDTGVPPADTGVPVDAGEDSAG